MKRWAPHTVTTAEEDPRRQPCGQAPYYDEEEAFLSEEEDEDDDDDESLRTLLPRIAELSSPAPKSFGFEAFDRYRVFLEEDAVRFVARRFVGREPEPAAVKRAFDDLWAEVLRASRGSCDRGCCDRSCGDHSFDHVSFSFTKVTFVVRRKRLKQKQLDDQKTLVDSPRRKKMMKKTQQRT